MASCEGETYRFSRPVGKQSTLQKASEEVITEIEKLQIESRKLKMQIDILKKYHEIERSWLKK